MIEGVFCFWTGDNEMTRKRVNALHAMSAYIGVPLYLVTPDVLKEYEVVPFHPALKHLSNTHKSDYLRAYFMHHFGGGYCDIKHVEQSWVGAFKRLRESDKMVLGYNEVGENAVAQCDNEQQRSVLKQNWEKLIGCGAFICKPKTEFTKEWVERVEGKLSANYDKLERGLYPFRWTALMGDIFHPLALKYHKDIIQDNTVKPNFNIPYR